MGHFNTNPAGNGDPGNGDSEGSGDQRNQRPSGDAVAVVAKASSCRQQAVRGHAGNVRSRLDQLAQLAQLRRAEQEVADARVRVRNLKNEMLTLQDENVQLRMALNRELKKAKYNIKWGQSNKKKHSSLANQSDVQDMPAKYKKKFRAILEQNKLLARALADAKARISELEGAGSRQQKIDSLALPQIKFWLEANVQLMHKMAANNTRVIKLLQDIMTPEQDISITNIADMDLSYSLERRRSLHPPGRHVYDEFGNVTVIPEESDSMIDKSEHPLNSVMIEEDPEVNWCSRVTIRRKNDNTRSPAGRRNSRLDTTPVVSDVDQDSDSAEPEFQVLDEEASILLREVMGQEKTVVCAEPVVLPPPDKEQGPSVDEYSAALSCRPKLPRTRVTSKDTNGLFSEDFLSSPMQTRQRTREPRKAPHRATCFVNEPEGKTKAPEDDGLGDMQPCTANTEVNVERNGDLPEKKKIEAGNDGGTVEKEVSQKADRLSKQARRTGKKLRSKAQEVSPAGTEPPPKSNGILNPKPMDMDVGAGSSTGEEGATQSLRRSSRRNLQPKSYKLPSTRTCTPRPSRYRASADT
ncbi:hypothetical protein HPB52_009423 [Rhipicephalus sanguineus]|uniref:Shugoshin C-terminal domain-containing protein n=1 Tax=Rhipicephalus sanguineus TaxID=34632 RepID=A0A9D4YMQ3_RHISA|nr:hypothetical protein HPB52_009423 [Rhipicephalus sanguineus]